MNKTQVKKWIDMKRSEAIETALEELDQAQAIEVADFIKKVGAQEFVEILVKRVEELVTYVEDYKQGLVANGEYSLKFKSDYYTLGYNLRHYLHKTVPDLVVDFMDNELDFDQSQLSLRHRQQRRDLIEGININYTNVTINAMSFKSAKESAEYLEQLGFDVSELREESVVTSLTAPIDTSYLKLP